MTRAGNRLPTGHDNVGRFVKGVTGNPGGRPRSLSSYIKEATLEGRDLVDFVLRVFKGEERIGKRAPTLRDRFEVA